jgi:hypothetical protein
MHASIDRHIAMLEDDWLVSNKITDRFSNNAMPWQEESLLR